MNILDYIIREKSDYMLEHGCSPTKIKMSQKYIQTLRDYTMEHMLHPVANGQQIKNNAIGTVFGMEIEIDDSVNVCKIC